MARKKSHFFGVERLGALSDGIFAIVLTLLVLDLRIPDLGTDASDNVLLTELNSQLPNFVAWVISFILIARIWQEQHIISAHMARSDSTVVVLNMVLLACCSLVPFGSSLAGNYHDEALSVVIFSFILILNGIAMAAYAWYVASSESLHGDFSTRSLRPRAYYHMLVIPGVALFAICLGILHHTLVGIAAWLVEPAFAFGFWHYVVHQNN